MTKRPQVRLDDDVAAALEAVTERSGRSLSAEANQQLRHTLGITKGASAPAAASRVTAPSGIIGAGKGPSPARATADAHRRARTR